jgi:predicted DNA-binding transcriptional regulator YafY
MDDRVFKLTRIRNLTVTNDRFDIRGAPAVPAQKRAATLPPPCANIVLKIAHEMAYRVYDEFCEDSVAVQPDGSFLVSVTWPEDDWVYGTILSYGDQIEVLAPEHVREIIREKALQISKRYR